MMRSSDSSVKHALGQDYLPWILIGLQLLLIGCVAGWNFYDARLESRTYIGSLLLGSSPGVGGPGIPKQLAVLFGGLLWASILVGVLSVTALFWGGTRTRSARYIGILCALLALWLTVFARWQQIAWYGHRYRAGPVIE
ncbi:MAG TPA: hypothetical protein DDW52_03265, partial [Planctomycetaceae bacterium]|nr:hypothetical protein [Planctomycetaceae bacterium]